MKTKTLKLKDFVKELQSFWTTTTSSCEVYIVLDKVEYPIRKENIDAYADNTLKIKISKTK
jgi:hypothetical protein